MSVFGRLYLARFKGVRFLVTGAVATSGGRKLATHEYPKSSRRFVEDLGKLQQSFTLTGLIRGSNYFRDRDNLIKKLEEEGLGILVHPFLGSLQVVAEPYTLQEDLTRVGEATFIMTFKVASKNIYPKEKDLSLIGNKQSDVFTAVQDFISGNWGLSHSENYAEAAQRLEDVADGFVNASRTINVATDTINSFGTTVTDFRNNISTLIRNSSQLSNSFTNVWNSVLLLATNPSNQFELLKGMFQFNSGETISPTTTIREERKDNQDMINNGMNVNALAGCYLAASKIEFENNEDLKEIYEELEKQYNFVVENLDGDILDTLNDLRDSWRQYAQKLEIDINKIIQQDLKPTPVTVLSYKLYGSTDNYEQIIKLNDLVNPAEISGTSKVLTR